MPLAGIHFHFMALMIFVLLCFGIQWNSVSTVDFSHISNGFAIIIPFRCLRIPWNIKEVCLPFFWILLDPMDTYIENSHLNNSIMKHQWNITPTHDPRSRIWRGIKRAHIAVPLRFLFVHFLYRKVCCPAEFWTAMHHETSVVHT